MAKTKTIIKVDPDEARGRLLKILPILKKTYPDAKIALNWGNPWNLLVAVILSAQCTDVRVNIITKDLFRKYKSPQDYLDVPIEELEQDIRPSGFFRNKAKNIRGAAKKVIEDFNGTVPGTMEELLTLPGAGRKTANCILGNAFGIGGITCDTHVIRLSRRLGLSENKDPVKLEFDLMEIVPKKRFGGWTMFSHYIIWHGPEKAIWRLDDVFALYHLARPQHL
ncbi:MAG: endonuclease III [Planctomycetota bacterium]|jgi:endonuclease-3